MPDCWFYVRRTIGFGDLSWLSKFPVALLCAAGAHGRQMLHRLFGHRARLGGGIQARAGVDLVAHVSHPLTVGDGLLE